MSDDLKARLLKHRIPEGEVEIPGVGTVRVRGLSRGEAFAMQKSRDDGGIKDEQAWDRRTLSLGLVEPTMTEDEVGEWQRNSPAMEIEAVVDKIRELSGQSEGAEKSGVPDVRDEPGDGVRVPASGEVVDDGRDVAGVHV